MSFLHEKLNQSLVENCQIDLRGAGYYCVSIDTDTGCRLGEYREGTKVMVYDEYVHLDGVHVLGPKALEEKIARARNEALREAADRLDRKIKQIQPEMTRQAQQLAASKKPRVQYAIRRAALDARMSDRDMILALIKEDTPDEQ